MECLIAAVAINEASQLRFNPFGVERENRGLALGKVGHSEWPVPPGHIHRVKSAPHLVDLRSIDQVFFL